MYGTNAITKQQRIERDLKKNESRAIVTGYSKGGYGIDKDGVHVLSDQKTTTMFQHKQVTETFLDNIDAVNSANAILTITSTAMASENKAALLDGVKKIVGCDDFIKVNKVRARL